MDPVKEVKKTQKEKKEEFLVKNLQRQQLNQKLLARMLYKLNKRVVKKRRRRRHQLLKK